MSLLAASMDSSSESPDQEGSADLPEAVSQSHFEFKNWGLERRPENKNFLSL